MLHNPAFLDPDGEVVWSTPELLRENTQNKPVRAVVNGASDTVVPGTAWWELLYGSKVINGRAIKAARTLLGWSKAKLARESGVSTSTIAQLEGGHGATKAHSRTAQKLRHALEVGDIEFIDNNGDVQGVRLRGREVRFVGPDNDA